MSPLPLVLPYALRTVRQMWCLPDSDHVVSGGSARVKHHTMEYEKAKVGAKGEEKEGGLSTTLERRELGISGQCLGPRPATGRELAPTLPL